ncbi:unnamed protein product [Orchesella dallaii]|uniref:Enoyl-CoA delta isomerase 2, mitochondrial n=1 Tax=Orchesella dallaii TaxID=48710 RepID=A0ABP1RBR7_9HEXA
MSSFLLKNVFKFSNLANQSRAIAPVANAGGVLSTRDFSVSSKLESDYVSVNVEHGVRKIVLNRPQAKNALRFDMVEKIGLALLEASTDSATKLVTLTGVGDYFTSGNDLNNWDITNQTLEEMKERGRTSIINHFLKGLLECTKPIIALVNGPAIGVGATMLPFCDQVLASDKAFFATPFTAIGIVPEVCSSYLFPKIMGYSKANDVLLFGHRLTAEEAQTCGFITKVFPSDVFADSCQKLIHEYSQLPLEPLMKAKELIRAPEREKLRQLATYELNVVNTCIDTPYFKANLANFFANKVK